MVIIGENIHILSKKVSEALSNKDAKVIQEMAKAQAEAGVDYIDLNIGPARKNPDIMAWLVETVQEVVDLPLSLDSTNPQAVEAGLKVAKWPPLINSASGRTDSKEQMLPLATKYKCDVVISVLNDQGIPADAEARAESIMDTVTYANELGIENERIWVDPIIMPVSVDQKAVMEAMEFTKMLQDLLPGVKSTVGLSNVSNGTPKELRGILNRTYLVMLQKCGLYSAIADAFDQELMDLVKGRAPEIVELIHKVMDGEDIDADSLPPKERDYVKTAKVLMGESLYSHTWLEL
ncbi:MAG: dihydropteroate synthase [Deltaproteobacteria bacterium]|nr:MAG: dihydropteroate synthase [Deltaproteobacteria bacterium]